jgi:hypothetical protein
MIERSGSSRAGLVIPIGVAAGLTVVFAFGVSTPVPSWFELLRAAVGVGFMLWAAFTPHFALRGGALATAFACWVAVVTALSGRLSPGILFAVGTFLALFVLAKERGRSAGPFRSGLLAFALISIAINAVSVISPDLDATGHDLYYMGGKNALAMTGLPLLYLLHVTWSPTDARLRTVRWIACTALAVSVVIAGSATGKVMVFAYIAFLLLRGRGLRQWWWWFFSIPLIHLALLSGWLLTSSEWARRFVEDALGKRTDFTDRSAIWEVAWERVRHQPLGEGRGYSFLAERFGGISEAHNMLLEALITVGWPGLLLLLALVAIVMQKSATSSESRAGVYFVWLACIVGTMESYTYHFGFWLLLGLAAAVSSDNPVRRAPPMARPGEIATSTP